MTEFFTESVPDAKVSFLTSDHSSADVPFVGVITSSAEAIVDTAAQEGLIGRPALLRLFEALRKFGLKGRWTGEASEARGIGGAAKTLGVVEVPVGIGRVPGVVALTVVTEDVPFLLPVSLLRALKASVDLGENRLHLRAVNTDCVMNVLPSGHPTVSVLDFGHGWFLPEICRGHVPESAFRSSPKQVQLSTGPHDHILSSSAQATLATFIGGPDVRCSSPPCSRAAMGRDHPRAQPATRTRALARALGQALVCSSVGTLSINNKPVVAAPFADTFDHVNFGQHEHLDYSGAGRHGQGASIPQLLGEQEAHGHDAGEGDTRAGAEQVQARGPLPERRGQRSQELVPLQPVQEQVEPVAKDSSHHDREAPRAGHGSSCSFHGQAFDGGAGQLVPENPQGAAEGEGQDHRDHSRRPSATVGRSKGDERGPPSTAGHGFGQLPGVRASRGEPDLNGDSGRRPRPDDPELCPGDDIRVPKAEAVRGGDKAPVQDLCKQAEPDRLGESSKQPQGDGHRVEQLPGHACGAEEPGGPEPGGDEQDVKDPLDGMTTKRGKVLKRASPNVLDCWIKERQPFCEDYVVVD